jgi:uncharacterized damage-inducible protein DinB
MSATSSAAVIAAYLKTNARILKLVEPLSDEQLFWQPKPGAHSIAFILWHIARWADHLQATIPGMTSVLAKRLAAGQQLWEKERLAERWGIDSLRLGDEQTGTRMDNETAGELGLPPKQILLGYVRDALAAADRAVSAVDDQQFQELERPQSELEVIQQSRAASVTVGGAIMVHIMHNNRHLGEMEYILGLQGLFGSVTV